ncbi:hypothetical protein ACHAP8_006205 [Fusarium lateritium]
MERPTEFDNLVHQYPLGSDVIRTSEGGVCLYKVYKNEYTSSNGESAAFSLTIRRINYNGQIFGWEHSRLVIPNFTGLRSACELDPSPFPVYENTDGAVIKNSLEQRGQHFENLKDIHCGMYSGPFILAGSSTMLNRKELRNARIMIDAEAFLQYAKAGELVLLPLDESELISQDAGKAIPDWPNLWQYCPDYVMGFHLETNQWGYFYIFNIEATN